ncbi:obscurin-like protein 1 isoform X9 [Anguilla anguilla]|uniref:obscurin-like protein 1 isoform X9 n=1 Tax=Anguilla anguilla TaxID=7936 RepID=UPI0015AB046E|nr:obscurin-like protein 1 isoform X9 [Anguilla anguilla]
MDVFGGAPRFLAYPRPVIVQSGTDAALKCQIAGDPRPAVIWERNNERIQPEGRYRLFEDGNVYNLIISGVTSEDSGQYICKAKNSIGETYAAATLKVEGEAQEKELREENRPRFLIKPLSTRVGRGEDAVFSCKLWGKPLPEVAWEKDGKRLSEIFESTHFSVSYQDGGWFQLKIFKTRAPDGGVYTCKAKNEFGEGLAGAVLLVDAGPGHEEEATRNGYANGHWKAHPGKARGGRQVATRPREEPLPHSAKVKMFAVTEGKHAKFRCYVTGKPKPEIIWRKDGRVILSGRRYLLYEDREGYFTLKVLYCKQQDNGVYVCAASNTAGQTLSAVHLTVKEPLVRFKQPLSDLEVFERELAILECEVPEDSIPITWYLEDRRLHPGAKYGMEEWGTKRRLTIRDIGADDDGIYLCEMADGGRSIAEVAVKGTIVRKLPRKVDVLEGENAAFCVEVEEEEMEIHWYKDGVELRETHQTIIKSFGKTHILVFVNASPQDSGKVTFIVGRSKTSSQLRVKAVRHSSPSCPVGVQINTERANAALLSWVPAPDSRRNPPSGYVLERQEVGSQEWLQCLTTDSATAVEILGDSVPCEADYRFRICSVNKYGRSSHVEFPRAAHLVPVAKIQTPLQDALVPEGQDASFTIELSASVMGTWFLNGSQLQEDERFAVRRSRTHHSLRVRGVRDADNGAEITFIACGVRDSAALYIQAPLVKFTPLSEMDRNKFVEVGNPIVLYCELSDPTAPVHWYKNGVELHTVEGLNIQSEGNMRRIVIQSAEFSHSGVYSCDAIDDVIRFNVEVEAPPVRFSALPEVAKSKSFEPGSPILLHCEISDPTAQVSWYKDGVQLHPQSGVEIQSEGTTRTLAVPSADILHSGVYSCKTKGDAIKFNVDIKAQPVKFSATPEVERNKSIDAGCPIVLHCEISPPNAQVTWYKDGVQLHPQSGVEIQSKATIRRLVVQSAQLCHSGVYRCEAADDAVQFTVDIKAPPVKFCSIPEDERCKSVEAGHPVVLNCQLSDPSAQVSWYKDGAELFPKAGTDLRSAGIRRTLVVESAQLSDSGVYCCSTADDAVQFNVKVKAPPVRFLNLPEDERNMSVEVGRPILLHCEISEPTGQVSWYKDEEQLLPKTGVDIQSEGKARTLTIQSAELSHAGVYSCKTASEAIQFHVEVKAEQFHSRPFSCEISDDTVQTSTDVKAPPAHFKELAEDDRSRSVEAGCPIVLQCEISDSNAQVSWAKDGVQLHPQSGVDIQSEGQMRKLVIQSAERSHSGVYSCDFAEEVVIFKVDVQDLPVKFSEIPEVAKSRSVEAGCPIVLHCEISDPTAQVTWYKDGVLLHPQSGVEIQSEDKTRTLTIQSAELCHAGTYRCETADDTMSFKVDVKAPPVKFSAIQEVQKSKSIEEGRPVVLHCEISDSTAQVSWYKDGLQLLPQSGVVVQSEGTKRMLILPSSGFSSSGVYSCKTADDVIEFYVDIKAPPVTFLDEPEENLHKSIVELDPLVLSCQVSRPNASVVWYKDGAEVQPSSNVTIQADGTMRRLILRSAQLSDAGIYTCRAGDNALIFKVNIREPPVMIIYPKEDVHLDRHVSEEVVLSCELSRSNGTVHWYKDGQKLQESQSIKLKSEGPYRRLKILNCGIEDSGEYVCDTADDSIFFQLNITEPPVSIVSPSQSQMELCQQTSERVVLSCEISRPNATVRWYRDGLEVEESNTLILEVDGVYRRLIIPETTVQDSAEYVCDTGDDSVTFFVNIAEPPVRFVRPRKMPSAVEILVGNPLVLECEVSRPSAEVSWKKDGEEMEDSRNVTIVEDGIFRQLTVHVSKFEHSGQYVCDAKDDVMDFHVKVTEPPVKILKKCELKTEQLHLESDDIVLECELSRANGAVRWSKDGQSVEENEHFCIEEEGAFRSLVILNAELSDAGEYACHSTDDSVVFKVRVKERPVAIVGNSESPEKHSLLAGDDLILACEVSRSNAPVEWYCNGRLLSPGARTHIDSYGTVRKLVLTGLRPSDSGEYTCDAVDDKMTTLVKVQEAPAKFLNKEKANLVTGYESESVTLSATTSRDSAAVRWLKDWTQVSGERFHVRQEGNRHFLTIDPLHRSDSGGYTCDTTGDEVHFSLLVKEMRVKFVQALEDAVAHADGMVTLRCQLCRAKGDVLWLKDGAEIAPSRRLAIRADGPERSLTIHRLTPQDAGQYACESKDDRTSATLRVETPRVVEFIAELNSTTVMEGEDATFKCVVSPEDVQLIWQMDGERIYPSEKFRMSSNGLCHVLLIRSCLVTDSSKITAEAEGVLSKAKLQVQEAQVLFTKKMAAVEAEEFGEATLEVEVTPESGEVHWIRQNVVIQPGPKFTLKQNGPKRSLTVHNLSLSDRGMYRCETLHDRTQGKISVEPRKIIVRRGLTPIDTFERETATFEVELSHDNVEGVWQKDGVRLKPSSRWRPSAKGRLHSLTLSGLTLEDSGTVAFTAETARTSARLTVREPPVSILKKLEDQCSPEGSAVSLECELSRQNVDVKWLKNGSEVKGSKTQRIYSMGRKRFFQLMKCELSDSGVYMCDAGDISTSCSLEVYEQEVEIVQGLEDLDIQEDQNAVFMCEVSLPDIPGEWFRNGEKIRPTSTVKIRQEGTKHFLLICNVRVEDAGEIKFVAKQVESTASLEVEEMPVSIVKPLRDKTALEGHRVVLECAVSNPRCSIRWYQGSKVILPSERFEICSEGCHRKLLIQQVELEDEGTYSVQAGEHTTSARLTVEAQLLQMVRELTDVTVAAPDEARFECEVSIPVSKGPVWSLKEQTLHPGPTVRLEARDTVHRLTLKNTSADMSGVVRFSCAKAKSSARLTVTDN